MWHHRVVQNRNFLFLLISQTLFLQARKLQRCYAKQKDCESYETLKKAANTEQEFPQRLLVVPEEVENKDQSDGQTEWDEEFTRKYKEDLQKGL